MRALNGLIIFILMGCSETTTPISHDNEPVGTPCSAECMSNIECQMQGEIIPSTFCLNKGEVCCDVSSDTETSGDGDVDGDTDGDTDADTDADTDVDTDADTDTDSDPGLSMGSFCHYLFISNVSVTFDMVIGTEDEQVVLSADTGTCSSPLGEACVPIPSGAGVPLELRGEDGSVYLVDSYTFEPEVEYSIYANVTDSGELFLDIDEVRNSCETLECDLLLYSPGTCAPGDVCGWKEDGFCDDGCLIEGAVDEMFDDAVDCGWEDTEPSDTDPPDTDPSDTDPSDTDPSDTATLETDTGESVTAVANFCHHIYINDINDVFRLEFDSGLTLSAQTNTCSAAIGVSCDAIPAGDDVNLRLIGPDEYVYHEESVSFEPGMEYTIIALLEEEIITLEITPVTGECADFECTLNYLSANTCIPSDPCGWGGDGYCDEECLDYVDEMYDDGTDCTDTDSAAIS